MFWILVLHTFSHESTSSTSLVNLGNLASKLLLQRGVKPKHSILIQASYHGVNKNTVQPFANKVTLAGPDFDFWCVFRALTVSGRGSSVNELTKRSVKA